MSESSLPSNPLQPDQGVRHSANADAIERQSLYEREETIQRLLSEQAEPTADLASGELQLSASVDALMGDAAPQPEDLVVLIQALNQCNSNLLARVGELESALAKSQAELKAQVERSVRVVSGEASASEDPSLRTELNALKQKVMKLRQQMNRAHQANQSQRDCIQSLQQNLADTEQKHSALTETHAQLQTQFQEQSQRLAEAENTCRDLCLRLHRQQQYTLQFKAALKARAGSTSREAGEPATAPALLEPTRLSNVCEIRPWSAQLRSETKSPVLSEAPEPSIEDASLPPVEAEPLNSTDSPPTVDASAPLIEIAILPNPDAPASHGEERGDRTNAKDIECDVMPLDLPSFPSIQQLASLDLADADAPVTPEAPDSAGAIPSAAPASRPLAPISFDVKQSLPKWAKFSHMPLPADEELSAAEKQHPSRNAVPDVAEGIQDIVIIDPWSTPPVDPSTSVEVTILPNPQTAPAIQETEAQVAPIDADREAPTPEITLDPALLEQLDAAVKPLLDSVVDAIRGGDLGRPEPALENPPQPPVDPTPPPSAPRKVDLERAEEDLWRDLAKLVNISTDDIIQASLSGDFDAFTSIDFDALRQSVKNDRTAAFLDDAPTETTSEPIVEHYSIPADSRPQASSEPSAVKQPGGRFSDGLDLPFYNARHEQAIAASPEIEPPEEIVVERPPSPVVYPNRVARKLKSIAAIDLPSFPRPQPS